MAEYKMEEVPRQSGYLENRNGDKGNYALKQSSTAHVRDAYGPREGRAQSRAQCTYPNPPRSMHPRGARHAPPHGTFMPKPTTYIHAAPMPPLLPRAPHKGGQIMAAPPTSVFANLKPQTKMTGKKSCEGRKESGKSMRNDTQNKRRLNG
ncbi:hypothetical protein C8J57DRAFT_1556886 [Mycena rebaudengoi]|nr:hypothetical protein C8J57DRAFT_1556886 [Mycena rebaudengoi]